MSFPSHNFILTVPDKCSLYSISFSEADQSSPLSLCNKDYGGFSWLCWKLNKNEVRDTSQIASSFVRHFK